ncbi:zinc finger and BTB domain-containing protein 38 [Periophthalmus magnuspinnatus]|uniref:zinc finger and BTB domain-containing protein 38 n=1 Tax=Periophthalmus magnuspinnatus TaxID=409849 RepID=UPI00145B7059|nr:zinc finger and BTB domain-containing protein 38 [Periophthalmus magnuspinnatus]XP_055084805.1 zinc finger and BTB domain-containing protein 38 [Periophthalmus magnuspinnatus]
MKAKRHGARGEVIVEDRLEDMPDGPKNAKITLSFPLSAAPLPLTLTSPNHCRSSSSSSSPSPQRRRQTSKCSDEGALWKLDSTTDVKHRPFKPPRRDSSPSSSPSSSSSPMTAHTLMRKDIKSPPPLKCSKLSADTPFHRSPPRSSSGALEGCYGGDVWDERHKLSNSTASQTAQILFSLGSAYNRPGDAEGREKITRRPAGKPGGSHGPSLHPPTLHLPPPLPPPPPSEGHTAPSHPSSYSPSDSLKPELICGVCHRLFSSAASLTVHMRLHRGSRALSCRYCGKVFIHSKRLQSHEASCRVPELPSSSLGPPSLTMQPKEEPLEEGEVRVEGGVIVAQADITKPRPGKKAQNLLAQIQSDDAAAAELLAGDEHHFVKVVDGNVIYFCSVCERSYMTLSSLKRHSNVHSWRRKYPCHYCDKVFALAEYRTKHEVWHTGERRYQCIFCWDAFATYYNLKTHQKTIHGINPSLISSEKTANGGYKQKANALKLYRLLPMRSQKRPYKTYSDGLHNGLLLQPGETPSLPVPGLDCALGSGDLQSLLSGAHPQTVKPDPEDFPDSFPVTAPAEQRDHSGLPQLSQTDISPIRKHDGEEADTEQGRAGGSFKMSSSSRTKMSKVGRCPDTIMPSVITYGHTKPSVIVHGKTVSSSVIVHSNQVTSLNDKTDCSSSLSSSQTLHKSSPKSMKKQRDTVENHRKRSRDSSDTTDEGSRGKRDSDTGTKSLHKSRKSHGKSEVSVSKQQSPTVSSQGKDTGPLCQITVRIGEEAIVKRSISETDLRRDKSLSPPKNKRSEQSSGKEVKHSRQSHSHHHHKHRRASLDVQETHETEEARKQASPDAVREYYFRQEVREQQESDHDNEDNLWRPYYSYKPKRKVPAHLQRVKSWQRKLQFKRSLRLKRRVDRLKNLSSKDTEKSNYEGEEGISDRAEKISKAKKERGRKKTYDFSISKEKKIDSDEQRKEVQAKKPAAIPDAPKSSQSTSAAPAALKRRPWTNGNASECGTCGRWFSSTRKRDKHELSHLLEFVCLFCSATFPSTEKLGDHQKTQHPKPVESPSQLAAPKVALTDPSEGAGVKQVPAIAKYDADRTPRAVDRVSSPSRLSRRALSRHTCPQCHKVCKTSSALNRHIRRHELSSSPERDDREEPKTQIISRELQSEKEQAPLSLSVSVINYSSSELPSSVERGFQNDTSKRCDEPKAEGSVFIEPKDADREPPPQNVPQIDHPINLTPGKPDFSPVAQSVLIMNGSECLDYRTPSKKHLDAQCHRLPSPVQCPNNNRIATTITAAPPPPPPPVPVPVPPPPQPPVSMTTPPSEAGYRNRDGVIIDRERLKAGERYLHSSFEEPPLVHHLRVQPQSRCQSPNEAQDLTMSSLRARERELEKEREREKQRVQQIRKHAQDNHNALLVPKEEHLSPARSPHRMLTPTTVNGNATHRHTPKPPCLTPSAMGQPAEPTRHASQPDGSAADRPSAHALPLPRPPQTPHDSDNQDSPRDLQQAEDYQEYPLPLTVPDSYRSDKKQDDALLMPSYPTGTLPFGTLGKVVVPNGADLSKIPFYPDPYPLLYGPQLLAYPYNLAALPVALNMMAPGGDKVEPLPFLPAIFNYATGPYMGAAPHPLVANTTLYSTGSSEGKKQRDSTSKP